MPLMIKMRFTLAVRLFGVKFYANGAMIIKLESYYDGENMFAPQKTADLK